MLKTAAAAGLAGLLAAAVLLAAAPSTAALSGRTSSFSERQQYRHESSAFQTGAVAYTNLPGALITVVIPAGTRRMLDVSFSAETQCVGASGWCTARPIVVNSIGAVRELDPIAGTDFAFDSAKPLGPTGQWGSHAMQRTSPYLAAGTYRVYIQVRNVAGATAFRLDEWTLAVELERP